MAVCHALGSHSRRHLAGVPRQSEKFRSEFSIARSFHCFSYDSFHVLIPRRLHGDLLHHLARQICAAKPAGRALLNGRGPMIEPIRYCQGVVPCCICPILNIYSCLCPCLCTKTKLLGPLSVQLPRTTQSPCARQLPMPEPDNDKESDGG